jgi:alginate production protein
LEPNLSNLVILTGGVGIRPSANSSIDLVYHHYRQDDAADEILDSNLDEDPNGRSRRLGQVVDFVVGLRSKAPKISAKLVLGYFQPGNAFPSDADDAWFGGARLRYHF